MRVLYEDNHLIAVWKPAGVLTQGGPAGEPCLMDEVKGFLKQKYAKPGNVFLGLVHRLDRPVSGVILFAKTSKGASRLSESFRSRDIEKIYWASVEGVPAPASASLVHFLEEAGEGEAIRTHATAQENAKRAELRYETLRSDSRRALLRVELLTGRKHQIRAQLSAIGHPVEGDGKYGAKTRLSRTQGIALVARSLNLPHPIRSEERIHIEAPASLCAEVLAWPEAAQ